MRTMARFLVSLSEDPFQREEFQRAPEAVMASAGLKEEDRQVLRSGDPVVLRGYFDDVPGRPVPKLQGVKVPPPPPDPKPGPPPGPPPGPETPKPRRV